MADQDFQIIPGGKAQVTPLDQRPQVKLYFIGVNLLRGDKKESPIFNIAGRIYQMPPIGESLTVDDLTAKEIATRCLWHEKTGTPIPGVTTDPSIARIVKENYESGNIKNLDLRSVLAENAVKQVDTEALIRELRSRGLAVDAGVVGAAVEAATSSAPKEEAKPAATPAKSKTSSK